MTGFSMELTKVARLGAVARYLERLNASKGLRSAIRRSALLGAGTGAVSNVMAGNSDQSTLRKLITGAAVGGIGGAVTGGAFPAWFGRSNMRAADELKRFR